MDTRTVTVINQLRRQKGGQIVRCEELQEVEEEGKEGGEESEENGKSR